MSFFKKGEQYEDLLRYVYQQLSWLNDKKVKVERNVFIIGKSGVKHQIDVYYEFEFNDIKHKVIIECKNHKRKVDKSMIQSFKAVVDEIGNCTGIFASSSGFQSGAIEYAKFSNIELVTGGQLPLLSKVIAKRLQILLPNKDVIGQPFWTIMEERDNTVTGTYITIDKNTLGLFMSKKVAEEISKITGGVVRGVCQKHLKIICDISERFNLKLCIILLEKELAIEMKPVDITTYFVCT